MDLQVRVHLNILTSLGRQFVSKDLLNGDPCTRARRHCVSTDLIYPKFFSGIHMHVLPQRDLRTVRRHHTSVVSSLVVVTSETVGAIGHGATWEVRRVLQSGPLVDILDPENPCVHRVCLDVSIVARNLYTEWNEKVREDTGLAGVLLQLFRRHYIERNFRGQRLIARPARPEVGCKDLPVYDDVPIDYRLVVE